MKKRVLSLALAVILALGVLPITAGAAETLTLDAAEATYKQRLAQLRTQSAFRVGDVSTNCHAFARSVVGKLFGLEVHSISYHGVNANESGLVRIGRCFVPHAQCTTNSSGAEYNTITEDTVKALLGQARCGDVIQTSRIDYNTGFGDESCKVNHPHTMVVEEARENEIAIYEGNMGGKVNRRPISYRDFANTYNHVITLFRAENYRTPGKQPRPTLRSGSRGGEVKTLQTMLNAVSGAGLAVDGGFGAKTLAAVKSFQRSRGLAVDGVVGTKTWAALEAEYNKPAPAPAAPTPTPVQPDPEPAAPDPAPAPDPSGKIDFMPSVLALVPVTEPTQGMPQGQPFYFKGSILSNYPIVFARVAILTADRVDAIQSKNIQPNSTLVDIATSGLDSLKFGKLQPGSYVLYLTATDSSGAVKEWSADFSIAASHTTVRKGSKGDEVRLLQTMLNQIMGAGLDVDGGFGAKTLAAVKSYQSARGLDVDGVVGPKTWAALEAEYRR